MPVRVGRYNPAAFVTTGNPDTVVDTAATVTSAGAQYDLSGQLGSLTRSADGLKEWIYVQFSSTSTGKVPAQNQIAFWMSSTASQTWVVTNQTSADTGISTNAVAGIIRATSSGLAGKYVWLLRKAPSANVVSTATGFIKGDIVVATTASGEASFVASTSTLAPAGGVAASPWFWLGGAAKLGVVNSTTTSSVAIDTILDIT